MRINIFVAIFLCLLSVGMVSATLSVRNIVGGTGIAYYRALDDTVGINVTSSSEVSINGEPCTLKGSAYICIVKDVADSATMSYNIDNSEGETRTASIKVDDRIDSINYNVTIDKTNVTLDYAIQDAGFDNNDFCSGIKTLKVYDKTTLLNTVDISGAPGTCAFSGVITLTVTGSGTKSLTLEAVDNVGNKKTTEPKDILIDLSPPKINTGLTVKYSGREEAVVTISNSATVLVDIYFGIEEDSISDIVLDLSGANSNPAIQNAYKSVSVPLSNCIENITGTKKLYTCRINAVPLQLSGSMLEMNVTVEDASGAISTAKLTKSFNVDNTVPKVSIKTDRCDSVGRCFIHNGENKIILTVNKKGFTKRYLFFSIPGSTFGTNIVQNCSNTECYANISIICDSGSQVDAAITSYSGFESQDDAGNPVEPYSTYLYCDNNAPSIESINATGEASIEFVTDIVSGSTVTIKASVQEAELLQADDLIAYALLDKMKNSTEKGKCTKDDSGLFECVWTVSNINEGVYDANIKINISDVAGNNDIMEYRQKVFGYKSDNMTPSSLDIAFKEVVPSEINRIVVDMATSGTNKIPYYVYAKYTLSTDVSDVKVLHQYTSISSCIYVSESSTQPANLLFSEAKLSNEYAALGDVGRIDFKFKDNALVNALGDDFTILCNISAMVREGNYIYKKPQLLQVEIPFKLVNTKLCKTGEKIGTTCTPGEQLGKKIESVEKNWKVRADFISKIGAWIPKLQKVCNMRGTLGDASATAVAVSMITNGISVGTQNIKFGQVSFQVAARLTNLDACLAGPNYKPPGIKNSQAYMEQWAKQNGAQLANGQSTDIDIGNVLSMFSSNDPDSKMAVNKFCNKFLGKACDILTCTNTDPATKLTTSAIKDNYDALKFGGTNNEREGLPDLFGKSANFGEESIEMLTDNLNVPDVSNSIVMAFATQCYPAVLYNVDKWRQTECNYLYCLKMAAYTGTDISACDKAKFSQQCLTIVGEIFELPYANRIKNFAENAADYASNFLPFAASSLIRRATCPEDTDYLSKDLFEVGQVTLPKTIVDQTWRVYGCQLPLLISRLGDISTRSRHRGQFYYPVLPDMCKYADCVGDASCEYSPKMMDTIGAMRINVSNNYKNEIDVAKAAETAKANMNVKLLDEFRNLENLKATREKTGGMLTLTEKERYTELYNTLGPSGMRLLPEDYNIYIDYEVLDMTKTTYEDTIKSLNDKKIALEADKAKLVSTEVKADTSGINAKLSTLQTSLNNVEKVSDVMDNPKFTQGDFYVTDSNGYTRISEAIVLPAGYSYVVKTTQNMPVGGTYTDPDTVYISIVKDGVGQVATINHGVVNTNGLDSMTQSLNAQKTQLENQLNAAPQSTAAAVEAQKKEIDEQLKKIAEQKEALTKALSNIDESSNTKKINELYTNYADCVAGVSNAKAATSDSYTKCAELAYKDPIHDANVYAAFDPANANKYNDSDLAGKLDIDKFKQTGYTELTELNKLLYERGTTDFSQYPDKDSDGVTYEAKLKSQYLLWSNMGFCGTNPKFTYENKNYTDCKSFADALIADTNNEGIRKAYDNKIAALKTETEVIIKKEQKVVSAYKASNMLADTIFMALQAANANHMIDFMFTDYWSEKFLGFNIAELINPTSWKNSMCNSNIINPYSDSSLILGKESGDSTVVSCSSGFCQPVLTYATERADLENPNETKYYLYTAVYYISGGDLRGRNVSYNIYFNGPTSSLYGYRESQPLKAFDIVNEKKLFKSEVEYTEMCIEFSEQFPVETTMNNANRYCRPITSKVFNNGSPWKTQEEEDESVAYTDEYDSNGNRVQTAGSTTAPDPGVFED